MVGICEVYLHLSGVSSLKGKRKIIKSLKDRIRSRFNVSVAEMGSQDKWQSSVIGVAYLNNDRSRVDEILSLIIKLIESTPEVLISDCKIEIL
ncbi:MAG: DUF503 domain-containing protein [bacterium]